VIQLLEQAAEVQQFLTERGWRSCVIGGIAVIRWGEPRLTRDVDISLFAGVGAEEEFARPLLRHFEPRISDALEFAVTNRVVLVQGRSGIPIDIALAGLPFEEQMIGRASEFEYVPGTTLRTASAEDLIVLKAFANRPQDWTDVTGIAQRQGPTLEWTNIFDWLQPLADAKDDPTIIPHLRRIASPEAL
jgi:predicted nucleotidyltransferase